MVQHKQEADTSRKTASTSTKAGMLGVWIVAPVLASAMALRKPVRQARQARVRAAGYEEAGKSR